MVGRLAWPGRGRTAPFDAEVLNRLAPHQWAQIIEAVGWRGFTEALGPPVEAPAPAGNRRGRKPLSDVFLAGVAYDYAAAIRAGSRHPLRDVAERRHADIAVVRGWVYRARGKDFLVGERAWGKATGGNPGAGRPDATSAGPTHREGENEKTAPAATALDKEEVIWDASIDSANITARPADAG